MKYFAIEEWMGLTGCSRLQALICAESFCMGDNMASRSWDAKEWSSEAVGHIKDFIFDMEQKHFNTIPIDEPLWDDLWEEDDDMEEEDE